MAGPTYRPGSASGNSQDLGLLVERNEAGGFDRLSQFSDFGRLARLHVCIERVRPLAVYLRMARVGADTAQCVWVHKSFLWSHHHPEEAYPVLRCEAINLRH